MQPSDDIIRRLTGPPSPELLQRVARELYEIEPLRYGGKYGSGDVVVEWDSPMLSDDARAKCTLYAATIIASWLRAVLETG